MKGGLDWERPLVPPDRLHLIAAHQLAEVRLDRGNATNSKRSPGGAAFPWAVGNVRITSRPNAPVAETRKSSAGEKAFGQMILSA
jgi:hypothetical protein